MMIGSERIVFSNCGSESELSHVGKEGGLELEEELELEHGKGARCIYIDVAGAATACYHKLGVYKG